MVVILSHFSLATPGLSEEAYRQDKSDDLTHRPKSEAFDREQRRSPEHDDPSSKEEFEIKTAHNNTVRSGSHPCISHLIYEYDSCRKKFVTKYVCRRSHVACLNSITKHGFPKCKTVYARTGQFIVKCPPLPVDCKCAD